MSAPLHLDLVALDREIARSGIWTLLELVDEDPPGVSVTCPFCRVTSHVPDAIDVTNGLHFSDVFRMRHRDCGRGSVK